MRRHILIAGSCAGLLAACIGAPPEKAAPMSAGQALANYACPHHIANARAWINVRGGSNREANTLNVDITLTESTDTAVILRSPASTGDTLVLDIRTSPAAPMPGHLSFREPAPERIYKRVSFFCRGGEIASLDRIETVN